MHNPILINGINVYTKGNVKNKAVVFIHGNSLRASTFTNQFNDLEIPMVAFDLPGHGLSAKHKAFENVYDLPGYINALKNVIEALEMDNFMLVGHSLGGHIAIEASEELRGIAGMMFFGTPPIGNPPEMDKMFLPNPAMAHLFNSEISETEAMLLANEFVHCYQEKFAEIADYIRATDGNTRLNLGASIGKGQFKNEKDIIKNTKFPIAVIHGEYDSMVNPEYVNNTEIRNLWQNKTHLLSNCGHIPQMEQPGKFNQLLSEYYNSVFG